MTSRALETSDTVWVCAVCSIFAHQFSFTTRQVLNNITSCQENEQVQQANLFRSQKLLFRFRHLVQIHLNIYPIYQQVSECLVQKTMLATMRVVLLNTFFTRWTHIRLNGFYAESFCPQKTNNRTLFLTGCFYQQRRRRGDVTIIKLTAGTQC